MSRLKQLLSDQPKLVGIWIRVSTEDQARGESPEHHEKRAQMYAESRGWKVREVYHLEAVSGKSVMGHPETQRMLSDLKSGHISALIFSKLAHDPAPSFFDLTRWKRTMPAGVKPATLGERLRAKRLELGLSQSQTGKELGVSRGTIQRWERSTIMPPQHVALVVNRFLGTAR